MPNTVSVTTIDSLGLLRNHNLPKYDTKLHCSLSDPILLFHPSATNTKGCIVHATVGLNAVQHAVSYAAMSNNRDAVLHVSALGLRQQDVINAGMSRAVREAELRLPHICREPCLHTLCPHS